VELLMPAKSKKQQRFMAAVANNPEFAKKVGVPQNVGEEFMKVKKYRMGGMEGQGYNDRLDEAMGARNGKDMQPMRARRDESEDMEMAMGKRKFAGDKSMPRMKSGGKVRGCGMATKGVRKAKMISMKGS
jgi:hypothetical protein